MTTGWARNLCRMCGCAADLIVTISVGNLISLGVCQRCAERVAEYLSDQVRAAA